MRSAECGVRNAECGMRNAECEMMVEILRISSLSHFELRTLNFASQKRVVYYEISQYRIRELGFR